MQKEQNVQFLILKTNNPFIIFLINYFNCYWSKKQYCKNYIDRKIEGRKIFIRSRSLTKEEKAETVKKIKEGFKALSDYNKTKQ